jgi:hypothetical protein
MLFLSITVLYFVMYLLHVQWLMGILIIFYGSVSTGNYLAGTKLCILVLVLRNLKDPQGIHRVLLCSYNLNM